MRNSFVALQISSISPIIRIECVANNRKHHSRQFLFSILWWRLVVHCQWNRCKKWTNEKKINRIETNSYHIKNHPIICGSWVFFCNVSHWFDCFAYFIFVCISIQHHSLSVGTFSLSLFTLFTFQCDDWMCMEYVRYVISTRSISIDTLCKFYTEQMQITVQGAVQAITDTHFLKWISHSIYNNFYFNFFVSFGAFYINSSIST